MECPTNDLTLGIHNYIYYNTFNYIMQSQIISTLAASLVY